MPEVIGEIKCSALHNKSEFALMDSNNIRGGFMQFTDEPERDSLASDKLKTGMRCYVQTSGTVYEYDGTKWVNPDVDRDVEFLDQTHQKVKMVQDTTEEFWAVDVDDASIFQINDIVAWDFSYDEEGNIIAGGCSTIFNNPTTESQIFVSKSVVGNRPYPRSVIAKVGNTSAAGHTPRSAVLVAHNIDNCRTITCFNNWQLDNLFKDYTFRLGYDTNSRAKLFAKQVHLEGTFINSDGTNIGDSASIIAEVKTTADEALATANRVKDVSIDLGTRVNDLETVTSSHSNTITGIQGKVSELGEKVNTNTDSIGALDSKVKLNTTNVTIAKNTADLALSNANSLSGQVEEVSNQITSISGSIESLTNEVYAASDTATEAYDMGTTLSNKIDTIITPQITDLSDNFDILSNDLDKVRDTASSAQNASVENKTKITELTQQVVTATETANAASTLANNMSNVIGTIQSNASDALNNSQIALDALGGKKIVTILESEYGQLATKDPDTLYFCMPDSGGSCASLD